jgi:hypothetical protein
MFEFSTLMDEIGNILLDKKRPQQPQDGFLHFTSQRRLPSQADLTGKSVAHPLRIDVVEFELTFAQFGLDLTKLVA